MQDTKAVSDDVIIADDFEVLEQSKEVVPAVEAEKLSMSGSIKTLLLTPAKREVVKSNVDWTSFPQFDSIYEISRKENMTVDDWIASNPELAIRKAESALASWQQLLSEAALKGSLTIDDGTGEVHEFSVTKNQVTLIMGRISEANKQVAYVNETAMSVFASDDKKKDALQKMMYRRALRGDTRLAIYLHDRVDGRPAETKAVELDTDNARNVYMIIKTLFDKQLEVLNSGNGTKLVCCSRRAGKTHLLVATMLIECLRKPRTKCMYIGETMELSEALINKAVNDIVDSCQLKDSRGRRFNWKKMDNGSEIMVRGLSNTKDPDQIRGNAAKVIVIDEFFHLKSELLEYMQREVLEPMQMDYADDYMFICAGTPPQVKGTYGEYVWRHWKCDHFTWTWKDNPHPVNLATREAYITNLLKEKGLDWNTSFARREYNGEWAYDDDLLLYPDFHTYDIKVAYPSIKPSRIFFGIDYGVGDNDTLVGVIWNDDEKRGYIFYELKFNRLDIKDHSVSQLEYLCDKVLEAWELALDYFPDMDKKEANKRILWDADDNDQHLTDYMNMNISVKYYDDKTGEQKNLHLNIQNAHKTDKTLMYDRIRDALRTGSLLLPKGGKTEHECLSTILKRGPNGEVYSEIDNRAYHPDILPALRYAMYNILGV
jgi:hypothetical protein